MSVLPSSISIIVACDAVSRGIARDGEIPWGLLKGDMMNFRRQTVGHAVIMGRKTWETLPGQSPLRNRTNIVVTGTRDAIPSSSSEPVFLVKSLEEALSYVPNGKKAFVIGGQEMYTAAVNHPACTEAFVTEVSRDTHIELCDRFFPSIDTLSTHGFQLASVTPPMEEGAWRYQIKHYTR